jgi:hypothetical protein
MGFNLRSQGRLQEKEVEIFEISQAIKMNALSSNGVSIEMLSILCKQLKDRYTAVNMLDLLL